jgi:uncharacterized protein YjdB
MKKYMCACIFALAFWSCEESNPLPNPETPPDPVLVNPEVPGAKPVTGISIALPQGADNILELEETLQLSLEFDPEDATNKKVSWITSDPKIAAVSPAGLVTALDGGTITITAFSKALPAVRAVQEVTVLRHVETISLERPTMSVLSKGTGIVTATVNPANATDQTVTWTSSNSSIATVTGTGNGLTGIVTGVSPGTATITVKSNEGNKTAVATVTVMNPPVFAETGTHTLVVRNLKTEALTAGTTPNNSAFHTWTGKTWTAQAGTSLTVKNVESGAMGDASPFKPRNSTVVYLKTPITGSYTWKAKIKITGGTGGGLFFGAFANPTEEAVSSTNFFHFVGIRHTGGAAIRGFFTPVSDLTTRNDRFTPDESASINAEYTYQLSWDAENKKYTAKIIAADKEYTWSGTAGAGSGNVNAILTKPDAPYYPGFFVISNTITITEISIAKD